MSIPVKLPELGESVVEGTVSCWLVAEGDWVDVDDPLCEVTTDKVDAEIPSPVSGVVERVLIPEDTVVQIGAELAVIDETGAAPRPESSPPAADTTRVTPVARRVAAQSDVSLGNVQGTGTAGRITKSDVLAHPIEKPAPAAKLHSQSQAPTATASPTPGLAQLRIELEPGDRVVKMSPQRRLTAAHMVYSKATSPHVGTVAEVDMGAIARLRKSQQATFREQHGTSLTYLPFIAYCVARALREHPSLNASVSGDSIIERQAIHLAFAVETEKGLLVPVVRDADRLSPVGLALAIDEISSRARARSLGPDDLRGGTFTISNPGRTGNLYGFAIINQPQVAILRMGEMVKRPVVRSVDGEDAIVIRPTMHLALSYDHRAIDGAGANGFLYRIRELLEIASFDL
jgi:2-oxoglutarate dehydrogenase E2 component (dihydrolipoamide succinyltransferase)